jgi:hypothetical protein
MRALSIMFALLAGYWLGMWAGHAVEAVPPMPGVCLAAAAICAGLCWIVQREDKAP